MAGRIFSPPACIARGYATDVDRRALARTHRHHPTTTTSLARPGAGRRLHRAVLDKLGARCELDRERRGSLTAPNPVDHGKKGSNVHVPSEAQGIPPALAVSGANVHDSQAFKPLILGIPACHPLQARTAPKAAGQDPRGQGVPLRRSPRMAPSHFALRGVGRPLL